VYSADPSSLSTRLALAGGAALAATALCGCVSTQTKNARTVLVNQRTLDSESAVRVTRANPGVSVSAVQLIRARYGGAAVVTVRNLAAHPVSDLPISIERRTSGHRVSYLNGAANLPYFDTHVAGIGASASTVWVLTLRHAPATRGGAAFAVVGEATTPASTRTHALPQLRLSGAPARGRRLQVSVSNPSGVAQYGVPVYAVATKNGRDVGAATGSITELDGGNHATLRLDLFGTTTGATLQLSAPPTIFN
jgi:hypothetical protein